jgi:hypothetical protein
VPAEVYFGENFGCEAVDGKQPGPDGTVSCRIVVKVDGKWVQPRLVPAK